LPQDSIVDTDVASVIQSTRQGVGKQIADMVRRLINGDDIASFRCSGSRNSPRPDGLNTSIF
jgi:LacI family transcriptional regulator